VKIVTSEKRGHSGQTILISRAAEEGIVVVDEFEYPSSARIIIED
jgi:hypothetical protein